MPFIMVTALIDKLAEHPELPVPVYAEKGQEFDL